MAIVIFLFIILFVVFISSILVGTIIFSEYDKSKKWSNIYYESGRDGSYCNLIWWLTTNNCQGTSKILVPFFYL